MTEHRHFLPAAGRDWLLPFYDPLQNLMGGDRFRARMIDESDLRPGHRVLDVGCGTGSFVVQISKRCPGVDVTGIDPDPKALAIARRKAARENVAPTLEQGFSQELPFPNDRFDFVFSSFMFHHLPADVQRETLAEVRRVLRTGGSFHLMDFGGATERADLGGQLHETGFADAGRVDQRRSLFGRIAHFAATA